MSHIHVMTWGTWSLAVLAIFGLLALVAKGVRSMFRTARRAGKFLDGWFGDREADPPLLSIPERMSAQANALQSVTMTLARVTDQLDQHGHRLDEHLSWHSLPERVNGARPML